MLTINEIKNSISDIITKYPIKKMSLFGSYADGSASEESDIDILVEFLSADVSLFMLSDIKNEIESRLNKEVDLIHVPLDEYSLIEINKEVNIYEQ